MRFFGRVEYDGTRYGGWQYQPNCLSIQQVLEEAFGVVLRDKCPITGAGRTDAGVHARGQGLHFDAPETTDIKRLNLSVNALLPSDIAVYDIQPAESEFHARYSALSRKYTYYFSQRKSPLNHNRVWPLYYTIDWDKVGRELENVIGTHDFTAFCSSGSGSSSAVCTVSDARLASGRGLCMFTIEADRFVYKMVRSLVGTLVDIGRGRLKDDLESILASKDRSRAGGTAPAAGLVLEWVSYSQKVAS
ncbi:MAG: tRNA pseudouridine(38-40) synthase TruA [Chitinispirillaceae bacterium]